MNASPDIATQIEIAMQSVLNANNGYANVGTSEAVARGLQQAGLVVIKTADLHGKPVFRAFTKASQAALRASGYGVATYKEVAKTSHLNDGPDYEAMILDRQEAHFE